MAHKTTKEQNAYGRSTGKSLHVLDAADNTANMDGAANVNGPGGPVDIGRGKSPDARKPGESMAEWKARRS